MQTWKISSALALVITVGCGGDESSSCEEQSNVVCRWAGTGELGRTKEGLDRRESRLYWPLDLTFNQQNEAWLLDWNNHLIRKIGLDGAIETVVGDYFVGDGPPKEGDKPPADWTAPGAPGLTVSLNHPTDLEFGPDGRLYFASWHNHKIRALDVETGMVQVMCGRGAGYAGDGGPASAALFSQPKALAIAPDGSMFVLDQRNFRVRKISAGAAPTIESVVGDGVSGFKGDGGEPGAAELAFETGGNPQPSGALALAKDGRLYISDGLNNRIRRVDFAAKTIETIAGTGEGGFSGDGGPATKAKLNNVRDLEFGPDGRLYLADTENHRVRAIDLKSGIIETVVGTGEAGDNGEGLAPTKTQLNRPFGIAFDAEGALHVADTFNSRILKVMP
jgi:sugar lactone lactonase YvrE